MDAVTGIKVVSDGDAGYKDLPPASIARYDGVGGPQSMLGADGSPESDKKVYLKRQLGLMNGISIVLGGIIGSGIFISPTGVTAAAGSEALSLFIWGLSGLICMIGSLGLAELACLIPSSAGEYMYLRETYAKWVGFLLAWTAGMLIEPSGQAIIAITSAQYILVPIFDDGCGGVPTLMVKMLAATIILLLTAINAYSVILSARIQVVFMVAKVGALIIIVVGGVFMLAQGKTGNLATGFEGSSSSPGQIIMGFYSAMFAYGGWQYLAYIVEELTNPKRNIPLTYYIAMPLVTILYLFVNVSYFTIMDTNQLVASPAVAITWAETVLPSVPWLIPVIVAMSTFGACNGSIFTLGRLYYVVAREDEMPKILSMIHRKWRTPLPAAVFSSVFALFYILAGNVSSLIAYLGFSTWMFVGLVQMAVIILRFKMKDAPRTYKVPIVFPAIVFIFSVALVIVPVVDDPHIEFLYAGLVMLAGLVFYIPIVTFDNRAACMRSVTVFCQLLMDVCPISTSDGYGEKTD